MAENQAGANAFLTPLWDACELHSTFSIRHAAFTLLAVITLCTVPPRAPAQTSWGNALSFDGADDFVDLGTGGPVLGTNFTQEAWIKPQVTDNYYHGILGYQPPTGIYYRSPCMYVYQKTKLQVGYGSGSAWVAYETTNVLQLNAWNHVAATYDGNDYRVYVNGQAVFSTSTTAVPSSTPVRHIGQVNTGFFKGVIDEVRLWSRARSQAEIQASVGRPLTGTEANLVAYYRFNDGSGTVALDATPNHRNGTLVNGPAWTNSTMPFINLNPGLPPVSAGSVAWGDYNNDGLFDILLTGSTGSSSLAQVWRNTGSGFTNINAGLPGAYFGSSAWGDYDNDGRLDILLTGSGASGVLAQVWRNTESGFTNINAGLPGVTQSSSTWGDYDNDGRLDILLTGTTGSGAGIAQVWRNNGDGTFSNINVGLPGLSIGSAAWGDYDNDGRLDILVAGFSGTQVWHNNGDGTFSNINAGLPSIYYSSVAWGDYDNDGRLDILLTGTTGRDFITQVWRNNGNGTFSSINAGLPGVVYNSATWVDYDNDGRLEILLTGKPDSANNRIAQLWRNTGNGFTDVTAAAMPGLAGFWYGAVTWGDYDNDGRLDLLLTGDTASGSVAQLWRNLGPLTNTAPTVPTNLTARLTGRKVTLNWDAASDAQTPAGQLTYNLRIGTTPGAGDIVSPQASVSDGFRRLPVAGSVRPGILTQKELLYGIYYWSVQAVDMVFAGSAFAAEAHFFVYPPAVEMVGVTNVTCTAATLRGTVNPMEHETTAWFEYGLDARYGSATVVANLGSGTNALACTLTATGLLPWLTYHYRIVASNCVGVAVGLDATVTLPAPPYVGEPVLWGLIDVILEQGGSTSSEFYVSPPGVDVRVRCSNPLLLPAVGLIPGGSGSIRHLAIVPAPSHSGSAQVAVTATDGSRSASQTFNVTVTPSAEYRSPLLSLTNAQVASTHTWRFRVADAGTGYTNYAVEYRSSLAPTNAWLPATNVARLAGGVFEVTNGPPQSSLGFYRAKGTGFRLITVGFDSAGVTAEEGAGPAGAVLVFNGIYNGTVTCVWTDQQGTSWTNQMQVNGTTAVIPVPAAYLADNATLGQLSYLTLQLQGGTGLALGAATQSTVTIEENDADWQGVLHTENGILGFSLSLVQTNDQLQGLMRSANPGFFPTNALAQLNLTADAFTLVATDVALPVLTESPALRFTNYLDLRLDAANSPNQTNVSPTRMQGVATLVSKAPNRAYLDAAVYGTFELLRPPTSPATNEVPLYPAAP